MKKRMLNIHTQALMVAFVTASQALGQAAPDPLKQIGVAKDNYSQHEITWDNYSQRFKDSKAITEITNGVKVEDIIPPPQEYHYAAYHKPDPFVPSMDQNRNNMKPEVEIAITSILQRYELSDMRVVGIWEVEQEGKKSLISIRNADKENKQGSIGVVASLNDPIGRRGGIITAIFDDHIVVREFSLMPDGTRRYEDVEKWLNNEEPKVEETKIIIEAPSDKETLSREPKGTGTPSKSAPSGEKPKVTKSKVP